MKHVVGTVTIGQTPRTDVIPELSAILGDVTVREAGALDGLSRAEIAGLAPQCGDYVLVTRLADGSAVQVAERHITPRVAAKIKEHFDAGVPLVLLLCTGEFPEFPEGGLLVRPQRVLFHVVRAVAEGKRLGELSREEAGDWLRFLRLALRDLLALYGGVLPSGGTSHGLAALAERFLEAQVFQMLAAATEAERRLYGSNVNIRLLMEALLLRLQGPVEG